MEVRSQQPGGPDDIRRRYDKARLDSIRTTRKQVSDARQARMAASEAIAEDARRASEDAQREQLERVAKRDAVELSPVARASSDDGASEERIQALRAEVQEGRYLTPERRQKAAESMLSRRDR